MRLRLDRVLPLVEEGPAGRRLVPLGEGTLMLPEEWLNTSTLVTGVVGSGKSTRLVQPLLKALVESGEISVVNFDVTEALGPWLRAQFHAHRGSDDGFHHVDPTRPEAWRFNPVPQSDRFEQVSNFVAKLASQRVTQGDGEFFLLQARQVVTELIRAMHRCNPALEVNLRRMLAAVDEQECLSQIAFEAKSGALANFARSLTENVNARTTLMEVQNLLLMARDEAVAEATSRSDFDFSVLEGRAAVINVAVPESRARELGCFFQMFLDRFVDWVTSSCERRQGPLRRPIVVVIDELAVLGGLDIRFINTLRKRRVGLVAALQSIAQLELNHGPARARTLEAGFINRIYIPPLGDADGMLAEDRLGSIRVSRVVTGRHGAVEAVHAEPRPLLSKSDLSGPSHPKLGPLITFDFKSLRVPPFQAYVQPVYRRAGWRNVERLRASLPWPPRPPSPPQGSGQVASPRKPRPGDDPGQFSLAPDW